MALIDALHRTAAIPRGTHQHGASCTAADLAAGFPLPNPGSAVRGQAACNAEHCCTFT